MWEAVTFGDLASVQNREGIRRNDVGTKNITPHKNTDFQDLSTQNCKILFYISFNLLQQCDINIV